MLFFLMFSVLYFLPTIIGLASHKSSSLGIFLMNLFLGWTVVGWIVAFTWALGPKPGYRPGSTPASS